MSIASRQEGTMDTVSADGPAAPGHPARLLIRRLRGLLLEPVAVAVTATTLLFLRLMYPKPVGVADNYDGGRLLCHYGLHAREDNVDLFRKFVTFVYTYKAGQGCDQPRYFGTDLPDPPYQSSQLVLIQVGHWLTQLLGLKASLDLRALGFVACAAIGAALGLLFAVLRVRRVARYLLIAALLVITADAVFIDFAVSPLSEIAAVISILFLIPAIVLMFRGGRQRWAGLALAWISGLALTSSKAQMILLVLPLAVLLAAFPVEIGRFRGRIGSRAVPAVAALTLLAGSVALTPKQDPHFSTQTKADFLFLSLLERSPDPAADMKALGVPARYQGQIGKPAWCPPYRVSLKDSGQIDENGNRLYVSSDNTGDPALDHAMSTGNVMKFLITHPDRAIRVMNSTAEDFFSTRPTYTGSCFAPQSALAQPLGNYSPDSGKAPGSVDKRFTPVTSSLALLRHAGLIPLLLLWFAPAGASAWVLFRRDKSRRAAGDRRALAWVTLFLTSVTVLQFVVAGFGDGIDTSKHLNLSIYTAVVAVVTAVAAGTPRWRRPSAVTASTDAVAERAEPEDPSEA